MAVIAPPSAAPPSPGMGLGAKPGANTSVVPSPNATAATPAQLPSAAQPAPMRTPPPPPGMQQQKLAIFFGSMPKGTNALDNPGGLSKQTSNSPAAPNVASKNPPSIPVINYEGDKMGAEFPSVQEKSTMIRPNPTEQQKFAAILSTQAREHISKKNFAEPGKKKYPIEDKAHARNALARVSQFGSDAEKAQVRAKVYAKYPDMGKQSSLIDQSYSAGVSDAASRFINYKVAGLGQTLMTAGKAMVPGAVMGAVQGAMDPEGSMFGGAVKGGLMGAGAGALHGHMMQGAGDASKMYQKGMGWAKQQYGAAKNWAGQQMAPPAAPTQKVGHLQDFFAKIARQFTPAQMQASLKSSLSQGSWEAANKAKQGVPFSSNTPLTNPNDMRRANMLSAFTPGTSQQLQAPSSGLELDMAPKKFEYGVKGASVRGNVIGALSSLLVGAPIVGAGYEFNKAMNPPPIQRSYEDIEKLRGLARMRQYALPNRHIDVSGSNPLEQQTLAPYMPTIPLNSEKKLWPDAHPDVQRHMGGYRNFLRAANRLW